MKTSTSAPISVLHSVADCRCPQCRRGKMFKTPFWNLKRFGEMHSHCSHCGLRYEIEPGFFWGAMYISYAFNVGLFLMLGALLWFVFDDPATWVYLVVIPGSAIAMLPLTLRYSRVLMLYLFSPVRFHRSLWAQAQAEKQEAPLLPPAQATEDSRNFGANAVL